MGRRKSTELDRLKSRTWAVAVLKITGCSKYSDAANHATEVISANLLQKISRGDRLAQTRVHCFRGAKQVYNKGPLDIALWESFLGITDALSFGDPQIAYQFFKLDKHEYDPDDYIEAEEEQNSILLLAYAISDYVNFLKTYEVWKNVYVLRDPLEKKLNDAIEEASSALAHFGIKRKDIWHVIKSLYRNQTNDVIDRDQEEKKAEVILNEIEHTASLLSSTSEE